MLEVKNLRVHYGEALALESVSLTVGEGEIVAVLGTNGAGKSTLVNSIAGVTPITSGEISLDGNSLADRKSHEYIREGVALVPEGRRLFTQLTVEQNLTLGAYSVDDAARVRERLDLVHSLFPILAERGTQRAGTLSGGQQQMAAIGRALMAEPRYLLMDEPSLGLAPIIVDDMFQLIVKVNELGVAVLIVEQNVHRTLEICSRAYVLEGGTVVGSGTSEDLLASDSIREAYLAM